MQPSKRAAHAETGRFNRVSVEPCWMILPSCIRAIWSAMSKASSGSWVTSRAGMACWRICSAVKSRKAWRKPVSKLENGSSKSNKCGCTTKARAKATRCCSPPDKCSILRSLSAAKPSFANMASACWRATGGAIPRIFKPNATFCHTLRCGSKA